MQKVLCIATAAALCTAMPSAQAVVLNPHGTGQVLIYPYYTVNAGFGTLLSVVNTTAQGKALKVRFHEGYNGRAVADFNVYLSPYDAWVGQVFDASSDGTGAAAIATNDNSCTVPTFARTFGPAPGQGPGVLTLSSASYTGANIDRGPTSLARTREGYLEIIEMGEVTDAQRATLDAITHGSNGVPSKCSQLVDAWSSGGYWTTNASTDLDPPAGGLYGAESIINIGVGLIYTVNAEAIDGFSSVVQHTPPGNAAPDLNTASKDANGLVSAFVPVGSGMVEARYSQPEDAISALFMADALYNEYVVDPNLDASSDWIVTFPTKRFYTDPALMTPVGFSARAPFDVIFSSANGGAACSPIGSQLTDREENSTLVGCGFLCPSTFVGNSVCYAANALTFGTSVSALGSHLTLLAEIETGNEFHAGELLLFFTLDSQGDAVANHVLTSANGVVLNGLPALGFLAVDYVNGNVTPNTLANYSGAYPHRATVCTKVVGPFNTCP